MRKMLFACVAALFLAGCEGDPSGGGNPEPTATGSWTGNVGGGYFVRLELTITEGTGGAVSGSWRGEHRACGGAGAGVCPEFSNGAVTGSRSGSTVNLNLATTTPQARTLLQGTLSGERTMNASISHPDHPAYTQSYSVTLVR